MMGAKGNIVTVGKEGGAAVAVTEEKLISKKELLSRYGISTGHCIVGSGRG